MNIFFCLEFGFALGSAKLGSASPSHGQLELLDLSSWTWETRNSYYKNSNIHGFATLYFFESFYVFGGYTYPSSKLTTIRSYSPKTDFWINQGNLLRSHYYHNVIFSSGVFLVLGDYSENNPPGHKSEKCVPKDNKVVCEQQETFFGSVE